MRTPSGGSLSAVCATERKINTVIITGWQRASPLDGIQSTKHGGGLLLIWCHLISSSQAETLWDQNKVKHVWKRLDVRNLWGKTTERVIKKTHSPVVWSEAPDEFTPQTQAGVGAPHQARLLPIVSVQSFSLTAPLRTKRREGWAEGGGGDDVGGGKEGPADRPKGARCGPEEQPPIHD